MLDAWIIEEIKKQELQKQQDNRTQLELPLPEYEIGEDDGSICDRQKE